MGYFIRLIVVSLACSAVLLLTACSSNGGEYRTVHYSVYSGYDYPYYGGGGYYYDNDVYINRRPDDNDRPDRPDRPNRPIRPERPTTLPAQRPGGGMTRPGGGMGRPAMSRGGGFGGGRGGGGRGRR